MRNCSLLATNLFLATILALSMIVGCAPAATPTSESVPTSAGVLTTPTVPPPAPTPTEVPPQPVVFAQQKDPLTLDPNIYTDQEEFNVGYQIYDTLVRRNKDMQIVGSLAESWEVSEDGLTWTLHIRHGVKFHDGSDFKAEDAKLALDMAREAPAKAMFFSVIDSTSVVDEYTLQFTTTSVAPTLPIYLSIMAPMIPVKYIQQVGAEEFGLHPIGTGPYKFVEWVPGERIVLEANEDYWGGAPSIKTVIFRAIPESSTRVADLLTGAVDLIANLPPEDIERVEASGNAEMASVPGTAEWFIRFNTDMPPLDDVRVRQAMNYAVDVDAIIDSVLEGRAVRLPGLVPSHAFGYTPDVPWPYQYDPEKARELLAEAGYSNGFSLKLDESGDLERDRKESIDAIVAQLAQVGINVEIVVHEPAVYADLRKNHGLDALSQDALSGPVFDADVLYMQFFHSRSYKSYWHPPEVEQLIEQAGGTMDEQTRLDLYKQLAQIVAREAPIIPMFIKEEVWGKSVRLNWSPRTDGEVYFTEASLSQ
jgi:peptide/nickel transport system substrate-binding protein